MSIEAEAKTENTTIELLPSVNVTFRLADEPLAGTVGWEMNWDRSELAELEAALTPSATLKDEVQSAAKSDGPGELMLTLVFRELLSNMIMGAKLPLNPNV